MVLAPEPVGGRSRVTELPCSSHFMNNISGGGVFFRKTILSHFMEELNRDIDTSPRMERGGDVSF